MSSCIKCSHTAEAEQSIARAASHTIEECGNIAREFVAAPSHVLVRTREHQFVVIDFSDGWSGNVQQLHGDAVGPCEVEQRRGIRGSIGPQQSELLKSIETTEFFQQVRTHAVLGWLGHPMHGGNRGMAGWKAVGIEHAMQYQPPFGFYDSAIKRGAK